MAISSFLGDILPEYFEYIAINEFDFLYIKQLVYPKKLVRKKKITIA